MSMQLGEQLATLNSLEFTFSEGDRNWQGGTSFGGGPIFSLPTLREAFRREISSIKSTAPVAVNCTKENRNTKTMFYRNGSLALGGYRGCHGTTTSEWRVTMAKD